jgi:hypothetical protein
MTADVVLLVAASIAVRFDDSIGGCRSTFPSDSDDGLLALGSSAEGWRHGVDVHWVVVPVVQMGEVDDDGLRRRGDVGEAEPADTGVVGRTAYRNAVKGDEMGEEIVPRELVRSARRYWTQIARLRLVDVGQVCL